jgi:hypothetical protein
VVLGFEKGQDDRGGLRAMADGNSDYQYDAFISYSSKDKPWVWNVLLKRLEDNGLKVCIDKRDFPPGPLSIKNIKRAILTSRKTLLVITPDYLKSSWTGFEANLVQTFDPTNERLRFLPLLKEKCEFYLGFTPFTYLNFADPENEELEWERLLSAIKEKPTERLVTSEVIRLKGCMKVVFPSDVDLRSFCFDHFEEVYRNLRETDRWDHIAIAIISYCKSRGSTDELWNLMRQRNPKTTAEYEI